MVAQTARELARRALAPKAAERDRRGLFPDDELRALGEVGLLGVCVPEENGGSDAGPVALALALEELARADASVAVTVGVTNMVAEILARFAAPALRARVLPRLCAGQLGAGAFALSEPHSGSDAAALTTTARRAPGGFVLRGAKQWITSGDRAGVIIVVARDGDAPPGSRRFSALALEPPLPGLSAGRHEAKMGQRGSSTVPLLLEDVFVADDALVGGAGDGFKVALAALDGGRIGVGAQAIGMARAALETAIAYARERRQFDRPIADFQAIKAMIADAHTNLEAAWLLVMAGAWSKERGLPFSRLAAQAKLFATERAVEACDRAVQILGGYGYTREFPVERNLRDVRVTTIYEGTSQIQRLVIAKQIMRELGDAHA